MKAPRNLTHTAAALRPSFDELTGLGEPLPRAAQEAQRRPLAAAEPTIATEDPEPGELAGVQARHQRAAAEPEDPDPWVPYTVQVRRSTYMRLKQAEHWTPGFGEQRSHVDRALNDYLNSNKYSNKQLPPEQLLKVLSSRRLTGK